MFFAALLISSSSYAASVVVTQTVGQVADHVVTSREVQISYVAEGILFPAAKASSAYRELRVEEAEFRKALTATLLEAVVALEAENFNVGTVPEAEVSVGLSAVERATAGKSFWNSLEVSPDELKRLVQRKLIAKSFLKFKTNSLTGIISDQEAQAYFERNRVKFGNVPFASFKENIKTYLSQQQLEERLRSWFEIIKRKYKVRNYIAE